MAKLEYTFKNDTLFKSVFVKFPTLLKRLVAELLAIPHESIESLAVNNSDTPPDAMDEKFCRLYCSAIKIASKLARAFFVLQGGRLSKALCLAIEDNAAGRKKYRKVGVILIAE